MPTTAYSPCRARSFGRFSTPAPYRQVLVDLLARDYPLDHPCTIYEAATLPIHSPRREVVALGRLAEAELTAQSTLVLPPASRLVPNAEMQARLDALDAGMPAAIHATTTEGE